MSGQPPEEIPIRDRDSLLAALAAERSGLIEAGDRLADIGEGEGNAVQLFNNKLFEMRQKVGRLGLEGRGITIKAGVSIEQSNNFVRRKPNWSLKEESIANKSGVITSIGAFFNGSTMLEIKVPGRRWWNAPSRYRFVADKADFVIGDEK
jgi:hypothetical protein